MELKYKKKSILHIPTIKLRSLCRRCKTFETSIVKL